jgi:hypothetical protein
MADQEQNSYPTRRSLPLKYVSYALGWHILRTAEALNR